MDAIARFAEYASVFEKAYESDDWTLLEPYFTEGAVYVTTGGPPLDARHEGRDAVLSGLHQSVDRLDRRFHSRTLDLLAGPELRDGAVWIQWRATYTLDGAPDLVIEGEETVHFDGDRIRLMQDDFSPECVRSFLAFMEAHGAKLPPASSG